MLHLAINNYKPSYIYRSKAEKKQKNDPKNFIQEKKL